MTSEGEAGGKNVDSDLFAAAGNHRNQLFSICVVIVVAGSDSEQR